MILSNVEIQRALDEGRLLIEPQPLPRAPAVDGGDCPYQTTAVDLTLGDEIAYLREGLPLDINLGRGGFAALFGPNSIRQRLSAEQPFVLSGGLL